MDRLVEDPTCYVGFNYKNRLGIVYSNNEGRVIDRSNEAKALGIPIGAPAFEYTYLFEGCEVNIFSANFSLYGDMSNRIMTILYDYSPDQEIYSIVECFLDVTGVLNNLTKYVLKMRQHVLKGIGIPISVDIAPIKLLSKVANKIAKKFTKRTGGSYVFDTEEKRIKALKWLPVENVWGKIRSTQSRSAITLMNGRKPDKVKEIALDMLLLLNQSEPLEKPN